MAHLLPRSIDRFASLARARRAQKKRGPFFYCPIDDWATFEGIAGYGGFEICPFGSTIPQSSPRASLHSLQIGEVRFSYLTGDTACEFKTDFATERLSACYFAEGEASYAIGDAIVATSHAGTFAFSAQQGPRLKISIPGRYAALVVSIPAPAIRRFSLRSELTADKYLKQLRKTGVVVSERAAIWDVHLAYMLDYALEAAIADVDVGATSKLVEEYFYVQFCQELMTRAESADPGDPVAVIPSKVKIAENFVITNARRAPTVEEVAAEAKLSVRSLHSLFVKFRGVSPREFIREHRLTGVRTALSSAPAGATVFEIARAWHFHNVANFAGDYRKRFGELPSETLGRVR